MRQFLAGLSAVLSILVFGFFAGCAESNPAGADDNPPIVAVDSSANANFFVAQAVLEGVPIDLDTFPPLQGEFKKFSIYQSGVCDSLEYWYRDTLILAKKTQYPSSGLSGLVARSGRMVDPLWGAFGYDVVVIADYPNFHGGASPCGSKAVVYLGSQKIMEAQHNDFAALYCVRNKVGGNGPDLAGSVDQPAREKIVGWENSSCFSLAYDDYFAVSYYDFALNQSFYVGEAKFTMDNLRKKQAD